MNLLIRDKVTYDISLGKLTTLYYLWVYFIKLFIEMFTNKQL